MLKEPAIFVFSTKKHWFNIIGQLKKFGLFYYCNIATPYIIDDKIIKYIDYDLDVKVFPDFTYKILDEDEYRKHKSEMDYPEEIQSIIYQQLDILIDMIENRRGPFAPGFAEHWYYVYKNRFIKGE